MKLKTLLDQIAGGNKVHLQNWETNERKVFVNCFRFENLTTEELNAPVLILEGVDNNEVYISIHGKEN